MNKESIIELQKLDCNCNDCKFMIRDINRFNESVKLHYKWQLNYFNIIKSKSDPIIAKSIIFQFDKSTCLINYGYCNKYNKNISFIPNILQLDTQVCFKHRKDLL